MVSLCSIHTPGRWCGSCPIRWYAQPRASWTSHITDDQRRGLGFFSVSGEVDGFHALTKRLPQERRPIAGALYRRLEQ